MCEATPKWATCTKSNIALLNWTLGVANFQLSIPYLMDNGEGAFTPYIFIIIFYAIPICFTEMALGQFSSKPAVAVWDFCPLLRGVGISGLLISIIVQIYNNILCGYSLIFVVSTTEIPWTNCNNSWIKNNCFIYNKLPDFKAFNGTKWESSALQFWKYHILNIDPKGLEIGVPNPKLMICCFFTIFLVFLANCKRTTSIQKFLTFLLVLPNITIFGIFFATLLHPGSMVGLKFAVTPKFTQILKLTSWTKILKYVQFSLGLGLGGFVTFGSQNGFRTSLYLKIILINFMEMLTSLISVLIFYNILGNLSYKSGIPLRTLLKLEDSMLFSTIPQALMSMFGISQIWVIFLYITIYLCGLRSLILMVFISLESLYYYCKSVRNNFVIIAAIYCLFIFGFGLVILTRIGPYIFKSLETLLVEALIPFLTTFQLVGVSWIYGINKFGNDVHFMLNSKLKAYWRLFLVLSPLFSGFLFVSYVIDFYSRGTTFYIITIIENVVLWLPLTLVVFWGLCHIFMVETGGVLAPSIQWALSNPILRKSRQMFTSSDVTKEYIYRQSRLKDIFVN